MAAVRAKPLRDKDHCWATAVQRYAEVRLPEAEALLPKAVLESFRSFCRLWQSRYRLGDSRTRRAYQELTVMERHQLFERFVRQSRSWEATLRLTASQVQALSSSGPAQDTSHSRLRELEERESRRRGFYERLAQQARSQFDALRLPWAVRDAFSVLRLPAGAPMDEVRRSYRRLAVEHHPDRRGDSETMVALSRAYRYITEYYRSLSPSLRP